MKIYIVCSEKTTEYTADPMYEYIYTDRSFETVTDITRSGSDDDIIGFFTGNRFLVRNDQPLIATYIERILERYDLILPYEAVSRDTGRRVIPPGAVIARCGLLKEFIEYAVSDHRINEESRKKTDGCIDNSEDYTGRWFACHLRKWILDHGYRVKSETIVRTDPERWNIGYQRIGVLQKYMDTLLAEYIKLREKSGFAESFIEENPYQGDFGGKVPVWICWWQGLDEAPELVKACIASIERNIPEDALTVLVTMKNRGEYVTFTDNVWDKFDRGIISYTHMADMLRCELLYRYGGMWIDATYFVSAAIPNDCFSQQFFTLAFDKPLWGMDIMRGRWSSSLLGAHDRRSTVFQFMTEALWLYWEQMDETIDYFFWDYILDAGYRHLPEIRAAVDGSPLSPSQVYDLQLEMNQRISRTDIESLKEKSVFYKINRRNEYRKTTEHGCLTFYGYITTSGRMGEAAWNSLDDTTPDRIGETACEYSSDYNAADTGTPVITCHSEVELISVIREFNPYRIVDMNGYFADKGWVSRGLLDDVILHELAIERILPQGSESNIPRSSIYNGVIFCDDTGSAAITEHQVKAYCGGCPVCRIDMDDGYSLLLYDDPFAGI